MKTRKLGRTGVNVSELCLGAMNFGNPRFGVDEKSSLEIIGSYFDQGGNFIDTADAYTGGASERIVGKAIAGRREHVIVATKGFFPVVTNVGEPPAHINALGCSRLHLTAALDASLERLDTDYVDLYQVHCWDWQTPIEETLETLDALVRSGKTRYVGLSNYSAWQIVEALQIQQRRGFAPFVTAQMQYSLICRSIEHDVLQVLDRYGIGLLPWSPLGQGVLTGKYQDAKSGPPGTRFAGEPANAGARAWRANFLNAQSFEVAEAVGRAAEGLNTNRTAVAIAWLLARATVSSIVIGPKTLGQLGENLAGATLELPAQTRTLLDEASAAPMRYPEWFIASSPRARA